MDANGPVQLQTLAIGQRFELDYLDVGSSRVDRGTLLHLGMGSAYVELDGGTAFRTFTAHDEEGNAREVMMKGGRVKTYWALETLVTALDEKGKKSAKGKAAPRGDLYQVTEKEPKKLGPQATIVYNAVASVGPAAPARIVQNCGGRLKTKQPAERVVAYYLAQLKKGKYIKATAAPAEEKQSAAA